MSKNIISCDQCKLIIDKNKKINQAAKAVEVTDEISVNLCSDCYNEWNHEVINVEQYSKNLN